MRRRKAIVGSLLYVFIISGWLILAAEAGIYEGVLSQQIQPQVQDLYRSNAIQEDVLTASCATRTRGVFYRGSIVAGDFDCLAPTQSIYLNFSMSGTHYVWNVSRTDQGVIVESLDSEPDYTHSASVVVFDQTTDSFGKAALRIGGTTGGGTSGGDSS